MKNFDILSLLSKAAVLLSATVLLASCGGSARVDGILEDAPDSEVIVRLLDINRFKTLDTVSVDDEGRFSYKMKIAAGQPEFVYLFYKDTRIASLLLENGDRVKVTADTTGTFEVSGSEESRLLAEVERDFAVFSASFTDLVSRLDAADPDSEEASDLKREMGASYTDYYRSRVRYVMEHPYSMTVIPVFYQVVGAGLPVFGQDTDAIHFDNICDSLETVYPDSRYVKSLRDEADRRQDILEMRIRMQNADEVNFPDIELSDVSATKVMLSDVDAKVIILHFWSPSDALQKMFNLDVLKPVYEDYHSRGLEIYQVALDADKAGWARTVKDQGLEWINVCDVQGYASTAARLYNVNSLPVSFVIAEGDMTAGKFTDEKSLRRLLDRLL